MTVRENIFSIPPHTPFLPALVEGVLLGDLLGDWPRAGPFWLSDVTIILPTQRARLALSECFADALGGGALLPDIRALGRENSEDSLFLPLDNTQSGISALRVVPAAHRQFLLAALVEKWLQSSPQGPHGQGLENSINPAQVLSMAESLARLIDDFEIEGVPIQSIRDVVPQDLAAKWQGSLEFLEIALTVWPQILQERQQIDGAALRNLKLEEQAKSLKTLFGDKPVIAAGSTGSMPATARLLKAIANLRRGVLVLPGLDTSLDEANFNSLGAVENNPHGHSQYGLVQLLGKLERLPQSIPELSLKATKPKGTENEAGKLQHTGIRTKLVRQALALAAQTGNWSKARKAFSDVEVEAALEGVSLICAPNEQAQALSIALAARAGIAQKKRVGIITPDRDLARRIIAELKRFNIEVDDSAGTPLYQSAAGRLMRQILALAAGRIAPVDLMALLRSRHVTLGLTRQDVSQRADLLEFSLLRGQRPAPGFEGLEEIRLKNLAGALQYVPTKLDAQQGEEVGDLLGRLHKALAPVLKLLENERFSCVDLAQALAGSFELVRQSVESSQSVALAGADEIARWAQSLGTAPSPGPQLTRDNAGATLGALMAGETVHPPRSGHPEVFIWGRLEARLQSSDLLIAGALNEGSWPEVADPGPWLSRGMRLAVGLEPPERQHGLSAHDFEMAMGHENIILAYASRVGTSPANPSRLVQRLLGFAGKKMSVKLARRGEIWLETARQLDLADPQVPCPRPAPRPPARLRPRSLSITEVETLFRSPFDLYAKHVLRLRPVDPLGEELGARERGNFIHAIFENFVAGANDPLDPNAQNILDGLAAEAFSVLDEYPDRRDIWLRRFRTASEGFLEFERSRARGVAQRFAEVSLFWEFPLQGEVFSLKGKADRIDRLKSGKLEIIDFKTGGIPSPKEMKAFEAPQLLIEALIAREAGFEKTPPKHSKALTYIKIGAGPKAFELTPFTLPPGMEMDGAVDEVLNRISRHAAAFLLSDKLTMPPRLMPKTGQIFRGPYEHLARTDEWSEIDAEADLP